MKRLLLAIVASVGLLISCNKGETGRIQWEYKILEFKVLVMSYNGEILSSYVPIDSLNSLGKDGWEVVDVYCLESTEFPNFGNEQYHTGMKEQVATRVVKYVLKRKVDLNKQVTEEKNDIEEVEIVDECCADTIIIVE